MNVALVSTYEIGRQPFGLASPASWLERAGCSVSCLDLSIEKLSADALATADLIAFYVPMHTATRLASGLVDRVKKINPRAHLCFYGLYAPVNESYLRRLGAQTILGGEFEQGLVSLAKRLASRSGANHVRSGRQPEPRVSLERQQFLVPDRSRLPTLDKYARLHVGPGELRTVGYTEASRGCKHLCRHCPVVPVYEGRFRIVQRDVVLEDVRQQVARGAEHITFGDPDFFNGPTHALELVQELHREFPDLTYDATIKIEHLLKQRSKLRILRDTGCLFVISAVEAVDDTILKYLDKNHSREEFVETVHLMRDVGITLHPTFVTFSPWTTLENYHELLALILELDLVDTMAPVQYAIRLLVASSSKLLELDEVQAIVGRFDEEKLIYPWQHPDPRVDRLFEDVRRTVQEGQRLDEDRRQIFRRVWRLASQALGRSEEEDRRVATLDQAPPSASIPYLTEPWYC